jgi:hypothetical protein
VDSGERYPYSCPDDEGGRSVGEYGADGLYLAGPQLAQPRELLKLMAEAHASEPPDIAKAQAERQIAAERRDYRRSLPIPRRGMTALIAALRGAA